MEEDAPQLIDVGIDIGGGAQHPLTRMGQLPERNHYRRWVSWCAGLGIVLRCAAVCLQSCQQLVIALLVKLTGELANHRH